MSLVTASLILCTVVTLLGLTGLIALAAWPVVREVRERQRIDAEVRLAEWRLRQVTQQAMRRLLDEARRDRFEARP